MAGAFWCVVEDDRQGNPKKVMAEVLGEATRLAAPAGAQVEAVWLTDKATEAGIKQLGSGAPSASSSPRTPPSLPTAGKCGRPCSPSWCRRNRRRPSSAR